VTDDFEFLSPREFGKLTQSEKDQYLEALHKHLRGRFLQTNGGANILTREGQARQQRATRGARPRKRA
jgi:hypothetical protein